MVASRVRRAGDTSSQFPFTILVIANPALEAPSNSNQFVADPVMANRPSFDAAVRYIDDSLFGNLPNQAEKLLADPMIEPNVRMLEVFDPTLPKVAANSFVGQHGASNLLIARRAAITAFLATNNLFADVVYAVSGSTSHSRASAWYTSDDDARPGVQFLLDGSQLHHRHWHTIPGTVAIHTSATSLTAPHEFGHAISSYTNGMVVDLYVDNAAALNNKRRASPAVPNSFAIYPQQAVLLHNSRQGPYPAGWLSYHCSRTAPALPAMMDNYWNGQPPEACEHDIITRSFLRDRVIAKMGR
jgi:hypothetical protein